MPALLLAFLLLLLRNRGLYPTIFSDEWTYSSLARLIPLAQTPIPSYVYLSMFRLTTYCGDDFLACARVLNSVLFVAGAPFVYLIARRFMGAALAAGIALLAIGSPLNVYSAFFMPEASYFLAFWLLSWCAFRLVEVPSSARALVLGATLGLSAMIKVHALFLLPALCLFLLHSAYAARAGTGAARWMGDAARLIGLTVASTAVVRLGVGYLFADVKGLGLLGSLYADQASHSGAAQTPWQLIPLALQNLQGHLMGLALLFGVPFAAMLAYPLTRAGSGRNSATLIVYTLLMLGSLLAVTVLFTASAVGQGPYETIARLHMRYFNFIFPLLLIVAAARLPGRASEPTLAKKLLCAAPLIIAIICARCFLLAQFDPTSVDSPELSGFTSHERIFNVLTVLALSALICWIKNNRLGLQVFLFGFMPAFALLAGLVITSSVRQAARADVYDRAGLFARQHLSAAERADLLIIGSDPSGLFKAQFHLDDTRLELRPTPADSVIDLATLPRNKRWLLVVGNHPVTGDVQNVAPVNEFSLLRVMPTDRLIDSLTFSTPVRDPRLVRADGLSQAEASGTWTVGPRLELELAKPLPKALRVRITAHAFGPNVGRAFVLSVGARQRSFQLTAARQELTLDLETDGVQHVLAIAIPQPTSPQQLGQSHDTRALGMALTNLEISERLPK